MFLKLMPTGVNQLDPILSSKEAKEIVSQRQLAPFFSLPIIFLIFLLSVFIASFLDRLLTPNFLYAYWLWLFWTGITITFVTVAKGYVFGKKSLFYLMIKSRKSSPKLFIAFCFFVFALLYFLTRR